MAAASGKQEQSDPVIEPKEAADKCPLHYNLNEDFAGPSTSDSDSEEINIPELKKRMWKNQMLLNKLGGASKQIDADIESVHAWCQLEKQPCFNRKALQRAEDGVLHCMLRLMREGDTRGFVYGILPKTGPPIIGSSDSLRAWWKDTVAFERHAPLALVNDNMPVVKQTLDCYLPQLQDMNDNTIGSILSALIQHCQPPQRSFPFALGMAPPWWPTGQEAWWGLQGKPQADLGPPPYRKPHDLRKGWKLSLLTAVIKHMSPRFDEMRNLVWQSKKLQHKMSAEDVDTWSKVLNQEKALAEQTEKSLVIAPVAMDHGLGDDRASTGKRRRRHENRRVSTGSGNDNCTGGVSSLHEIVDYRVNSIDELISLYSQQGFESGGFRLDRC